jgi:2-methylcitrate dehydratase PrpD
MEAIAVNETYVEKLAEFTATTSIDDLPAHVVEESKRVLLDSVGCALAAVDTPAGQIGISYGQILGGASAGATVIGSAESSSLHGAAFANSELICALDYAPINLPGHVAPYVVPVALGMGEATGCPGHRVLSAVAVGLEISYRLSHAMDANREVQDGQPSLSKVMGFANSIFGATAAGCMTRGVEQHTIADALAIAASTSPVNSLRSWQMHTPNTSVKYGLGGGLVTAALTATFLAELGHRGDRWILDDSEFGYPRFIATKRWEPSSIDDGLGNDWGFPSATHFKPYPHCRVPHGVFDVVRDVVASNAIAPDDIEAITAYGEAWATGLPTYMNREIDRPQDAQFSFAHGLAVAAHLVPPGREWQDPTTVYSPSVTELMSKVVWKPHQDWASAYAEHPSARPSRVEVVARGQTFVGESSFPKGSRSPDPSTYMTTEELVQKFFNNAHDVISRPAAEQVVESVLGLEAADDVSGILAGLRPSTVHMS